MKLVESENDYTIGDIIVTDTVAHAVYMVFNSHEMVCLGKNILTGSHYPVIDTEYKSYVIGTVKQLGNLVAKKVHEIGEL